MLPIFCEFMIKYKMSDVGKEELAPQSEDFSSDDNNWIFSLEIKRECG